MTVLATIKTAASFFMKFVINGTKRRLYLCCPIYVAMTLKSRRDSETAKERKYMLVNRNDDAKNKVLLTILNQ